MSPQHRYDPIGEVSVVVCARNAEKTLGSCLTSARRVPVRELIVVDGGSSDGTAKIAQSFADRVLSDSGKGLGYARQLGASNALGRYVLYLDSDAEIPCEAALNTMIGELVSNGWVAIQAKLVDSTEAKTYWNEAEHAHLERMFNATRERKTLVMTACLIRREVVQKFKFDPFFTGASEDGDFYLRLRKNGMRFGVSSAFAYHRHRTSLQSFVRQRFWYGRGNARLGWKHRDMLILEALAPAALLGYAAFVALRYPRQSRFLPYYAVWSVSLLGGTVVESAALLGKALRGALRQNLLKGMSERAVR